MSSELTTEEKLDNLPPALREIVDDFRDVEPAERLEYLLDFAMGMPDLPERLQSHRDEMDQVHECQTPVFVFTEIVDGAVHFYIDVPRESPTVRGYAAIVAEGLDGASPDEVLQTGGCPLPPRPARSHQPPAPAGTPRADGLFEAAGCGEDG